MSNFTAVVERDPETGLFVGYVPGFPGAHSQGESLDELNLNLREVISMLLEATCQSAPEVSPTVRRSHKSTDHVAVRTGN